MLRKALLPLLIFGIPLVASGDDDRGRLSNGQAFRTDAQGVQLVDYIAELEVTVDELQRRMHGLQYEVEEQEDIIAALKRNGGETPRVVVKDLLAQKTAREVLAVPLNAKCPSRKACPACPADPKVVATNCEAEITPLKVRLGKLSGENKSLRKALASQKSSAMQLQDVSALEQQLAMKNQQLSRRVGKDKELLLSLGQLRAELEQAKLREQQATTELQLLQTKLAKVGDESAVLNASLVSKTDSLEDEIERLKDKLARAREEINLQKENAVNAKKEAAIVRASLKTPDNKQKLNSSRSELKTLYNRTRGMVFERDRRYKLYKQSAQKRLSVGMSPTRSKRGLTMNQIASRINTLRSMEEISKLRRDLMDIQQLIKADKKVLSRVSGM